MSFLAWITGKNNNPAATNRSQTTSTDLSNTSLDGSKYDSANVVPQGAMVNSAIVPGADPYSDQAAPYRLPAGGGDPDMSVGGGYGELSNARRNIVTIGGGDQSFYNEGLSCYRAAHYGERRLPGREYPAYIPPLAFSEWLR